MFNAIHGIIQNIMNFFINSLSIWNHGLTWIFMYNKTLSKQLMIFFNLCLKPNLSKQFLYISRNAMDSNLQYLGSKP
jgi:hypothetical protein